MITSGRNLLVHTITGWASADRSRTNSKLIAIPMTTRAFEPRIYVRNFKQRDNLLTPDLQSSEYQDENKL